MKKFLMILACLVVLYPMFWIGGYTFVSLIAPYYPDTVLVDTLSRLFLYSL